MSKAFRFGVVAADVSSRAAWIKAAQQAEDSGYSTFLLPDRMSAGIPALFPALAIVTAVTTSLRVSSYVCCNEYRHPIVLAREVATLDLLSDGRFELGLGAGVGPMDFQQMGLPFPDAGTRVGHVEETLQLLKQFFSEDTVNFQGRYYTITNLSTAPRPVQQPHPPLLVAGSGERMLKIAAREADSIAIGMKIGKHGVDPSDAPLEQKIAWIKEEAGERFDSLELSQTIYDIQVTDSPADLLPQTTGWSIPKRPLTTSQTVE
ncbi:MAG TPA: TIGR03621 family F420-dependent LLM class oxidoreductase, partial [Ktedonobacteraceae bacterium]|nr:TIGR03621 family F420-dependent LLM class oxidoreductase [Ktedonobacteraceae bacterium]